MKSTTAADNDGFQMHERLRDLAEELKRIQQRHDDEKQRIKEKFKTFLEGMKQVAAVSQQSRQTNEMILRSMNVTISETIFTTCIKATEHIHSIATKIKSQLNVVELDDVISQTESQGQYLNEAHIEFTRHQSELHNVSSKQTEALTMAYETLLNNNVN